MHQFYVNDIPINVPNKTITREKIMELIFNKSFTEQAPHSVDDVLHKGTPEGDIVRAGQSVDITKDVFFYTTEE